ncbi:MAG: hypothetical protein NTV34_15270 [Proteobacteria bacterium]|nr:hypothetical protein [Pseudomonadota bacterium]
MHRNISPLKITKIHGDKHGVIAVLFLFVVGFIFAALSLSMQTGQIIERRIKTDQTSDSAVYAFASKSAQGLNFIAANNLAIAGASHMAGALHLAADWGILFTVLFKAQSGVAGASPNLTDQEAEDKFQFMYDILKPIAKVYFRSATGLTRLNSVIKNSFPYLGMADAIGTGGASAPSAVIIPFGAPRGSQPGNAAEVQGSFMTKIKDNLKNSVASLIPNYDGLRRINSDETFCLAYQAGSLALSDKQHDYDKWIKEASFGPLQAIGDIVGTIASMAVKIGMIGNLVGIRVGFAGCGFGESGPVIGGSTSLDKLLIANLLQAILVGPLSGRPVEITMPEANGTIQPKKTAIELADDLDLKYQPYCQPPSVGQWATKAPLKTPLDPLRGMCIHPKRTANAHIYDQNNSSFSSGVPRSGPPTSHQIILRDYDVACLGTILFRWEGFAGLKEKENPADPTKPLTFDAKESHPDIALGDRDSDLCPSFEANIPHGKSPITYPEISPYNPGFPVPKQDFKSYLNLSRGTPFIAPIKAGLISTDGQNPSHWRGADPRPGAFSKILDALNCAMKMPQACPFSDASGGYFMSSQNKGGTGLKYIFRPVLNKLNWICPASAAGDGTGANIRENLQFESASDPSRWLNSFVKSGAPGLSGGGGSFVSLFIEAQSWHNDRVEQTVKDMTCQDFEAYDAGFPMTPPKPPLTAQNTTSNDYCTSGAHLCWQNAMQKKMGDTLKQGGLSFLVPGPTSQSQGETPLEASLHYAVLTINPLRTDNKTDIVARNDGTPLAHCPPNMGVSAKLDASTTVEVCDIQPVVGFISRIVTDDQGSKTDMQGGDQFGGGDVNLASGGALNATTSFGGGTIGTSGFMAISQASVIYETTQFGDPYRPASPPSTQAPPSKSKNYQMFWPSWRPAIEASRVMTHLLPDVIAKLVED